MSAPLLIADDSEGKILMIQAILQMQQWDGEVFVAMTSQEAMRVIDEHPDIGFGLIDFYIPSQNGPAIMRALKARNPAARIALTSSSANAERTAEAMAAGAEKAVCMGKEPDVVEREMGELLEIWKS